MKKCFKFFIFITIVVLSATFFAGCFDSETEGGINNLLDPELMLPRFISSTTTSPSQVVAENVRPAVVGINSVDGGVSSVGSGVAIANGGYVLTNNHVIINRDNTKLYLADGTEVNASFVWSDSALDIAVLKSNVNLPYLPMNENDDIKVGEDVLAVGTPLTLQFRHTFTRGIISALNRTIQIDTESGESYLQSLLQHDASINAGNSGGPLINLNGEVVGINTVKVENAEGLGFAIPIKAVKNVVANILENGSYETPYLGVFGYDSSIASYYGKTEEKEGIYVLNIDENGPCANKGLKVGDLITKLNDKNISTMLDLRSELYAFKVGDSLNISYTSDSQEKTFNLTLEKRPIV